MLLRNPKFLYFFQGGGLDPLSLSISVPVYFLHVIIGMLYSVIAILDICMLINFLCSCCCLLTILNLTFSTFSKILSGIY